MLHKFNFPLIAIVIAGLGCFVCLDQAHRLFSCAQTKAQRCLAFGGLLMAIAPVSILFFISLTGRI